MQAEIENLRKLKAEALEEYKKAKKLADEAILKMGSAPKVNDYEAVRIALENVNKQAEQLYLKSRAVNDANSKEAFKNYETISAANKEIEEAASKDARDGKIKREEYLDIKKQCDEASKKAYDDAVERKKANDKVSKETYDSYIAIHNENNKKLATAQELFQKHNPETPPPTNTVVQSPEAEKVVTAYKEFFKNKGDEKNDWYKDKEPTVEKDRIHLPFKNDEDALAFAKELATKNKNFVMIDKETNKVLAYSTGDGKLYQVGKDGKPKEFTDGPLKPPKEDLDKLPTLDEFQKSQKAQTAPPNPTSTNPPPADEPVLTPLKSSDSVNLPEATTTAPKTVEKTEEEPEHTKVTGLNSSNQ